MIQLAQHITCSDTELAEALRHLRQNEMITAHYKNEMCDLEDKRTWLWYPTKKGVEWLKKGGLHRV